MPLHVAPLRGLPYPASFAATRSRQSWPQPLQRYFVSTAAGCPPSAAIFFLPRNTYSRLPHSGQRRAGLTSWSISSASRDSVPVIVQAAGSRCSA